MLISVLIPAYNEQELLPRTIASVRQSFSELEDRSFSYEIIVCDNNSEDRTAETALSMGAKVVCEPHNQIAKARNTAARAASGEWFIFLDADTRLNAGVLKAALDDLASGKACGGGARMEFDGDIGKIGRFMCRHWNWISRTFNLAAGAFIFCLKEGFLETGGFDERYYVSEEIWFSKRLAGWGRTRGMKFAVLSGHPVVTSSRKIEWYGQLRVLLQFLLFLVPGAVNSRRVACQWYKRPGPGAKKAG